MHWHLALMRMRWLVIGLELWILIGRQLVGSRKLCWLWLTGVDKVLLAGVHKMGMLTHKAIEFALLKYGLVFLL